MTLLGPEPIPLLYQGSSRLMFSPPRKLDLMVILLSSVYVFKHRPKSDSCNLKVCRNPFGKYVSQWMNSSDAHSSGNNLMNTTKQRKVTSRHKITPGLFLNPLHSPTPIFTLTLPPHFPRKKEKKRKANFFFIPSIFQCLLWCQPNEQVSRDYQQQLLIKLYVNNIGEWIGPA